jgi:hypothetical protein
MKKTIIIAIIFGLLITPYLAQKTAESNTKTRDDYSSKPSSQMTINYSAAVEFKAISRKKEYRIGELISVDLAMLNKTENPLYFLDLEDFTMISVRDIKGNSVSAGDYGSPPLRAPSFSLLNKGEYTSAHIFYLLTCKDIKEADSYNADNNFNVSMEKEFNDNRFTFLSRGCIDIKKPGKYFITMTIYNSLTAKDKTKKTAIGEMESTPLEITIIE